MSRPNTPTSQEAADPRREHEWRMVIVDISKSRLKYSQLLDDLLQYLFDKYFFPEVIVTDKVIASDIYQHYSTNTTNQDDVRMLAKVRKQWEMLKDHVIQYNLANAPLRPKWRCDLEHTARTGYRLKFTNQRTKPRLTLGFWESHLLSGREIAVVCNQPLFFRNPATNLVFRFVDVDAADVMPPEAAIKWLKDQHQEYYASGIHASPLYLLRGEIEARSHIENWFRDTMGTVIKKMASRRDIEDDLEEASPIHLGNTRTNFYMREIFADKICQDLTCVVTPSRFGIIEVKNPTPEERKQLPERFASIDVSSSGSLIFKDDSTSDVFALVTRIHRKGIPITIISADHTLALGPVAHLLTQDIPMGEVLQQAGWDVKQPIPSCFQGLFHVKLRHSGEVGKAELLVPRVYVA